MKNTFEKLAMNDMDDLPKIKLSQNIQALIGEIGEKQVLLRLSILAHHTDWEVFHNLGEAGYDILLLNQKTGERIRIEAKARQRFYTTGRPRDRLTYQLTDGEYQACDFLVAYFVDNNGFYIVPKKDLKQAKVNGKVRWRFTLTIEQQKALLEDKSKYRDAWDTIHRDFSAKTHGIAQAKPESEEFQGDLIDWLMAGNQPEEPLGLSQEDQEYIVGEMVRRFDEQRFEKSEDLGDLEE